MNDEKYLSSEVSNPYISAVILYQLVGFFKRSHVIRKLIEKARYVVVVSLAENKVEVKKKLVTHTESIVTDLTSKAVKMVDVFTGPHYHFQRRYRFHAL